MGTDVEAFLGPTEALKSWKDRLKSMLVFSLTPALGLVPATEEFLEELSRRRQPQASSGFEAAESWASEASHGCTIGYYISSEFGDKGNDYVWVWTDRQRMKDVLGIGRALELLGAKAGESVGLDRYRETHQWAAAAVLQDIEHREGLAGVAGALKHPSKDVRCQAEIKLIPYGQAAEVALSTLADMAKSDPSYEARLIASTAMEGMGPSGLAALMTLLAPGELKDRKDRWKVIFSLGRMGPTAAPAIPLLRRVLRTDPDENQRQKAAEALGNIGPFGHAAVPALIDALRDKSARVRYNAVRAVGQMGPAARDAVAALKQSLQDKDVHWQAVLALLSVGPLAEALPELIRTLNTDSDWTLRSAAAQTLGRLGKEAQAAVPALIAALADKDSFVCSHAAEAIGSIGPAARAAIPALQNNHKRVRDSAAQALQLAQGAL